MRHLRERRLGLIFTVTCVLCLAGMAGARLATREPPKPIYAASFFDYLAAFMGEMITPDAPGTRSHSAVITPDAPGLHSHSA